jgi:hypothetical protein
MKIAAQLDRYRLASRKRLTAEKQQVWQNHVQMLG